ncbi:unnamed protein product [Lactuca saligna]|uniref:Uncharacterized protein n=1 Tax=Lactuca saligna TaxID=75948 RepID=A0AA36A151_LACSI|nr:unnamed protein product [Lactuca saligna]
MASTKSKTLNSKNYSENLGVNTKGPSKLQSEALREAITQITTDAKEKKHNFTKTIELQIRLKNYDPKKDKRFSGTAKLPHIPRPKLKVCMLGDAQHVEEIYLEVCLALYFLTDALALTRQLSDYVVLWATLASSYSQKNYSETRRVIDRGLKVVPLLTKVIGWLGGSILALETLKRVVVAGNRA